MCSSRKDRKVLFVPPLPLDAGKKESKERELQKQASSSEASWSLEDFERETLISQMCETLLASDPSGDSLATGPVHVRSPARRAFQGTGLCTLLG